ncbi:hypothetical protein FRB90_006813 [Tulasnella sp. 427]|nr:hypothetical protein FRB90_006813 [Tulasnella sp. 427]
MALAGLGALELTAVSPAPHLEKLLQIVAANPSLERLSLTDMDFYPLSKASDNKLSKVEAPSLRYLGFKTSVCTSEHTLNFVNLLIVPPTTVVDIRMFTHHHSEIPKRIDKLFGYACERILRLDESLAVGVRTNSGRWAGIILECPPAHPIIQIWFSWWISFCSMENGFQYIVDKLEPVFCGNRELLFVPENTVGKLWTMSKVLGPWGRRLPRLSHLAVQSAPWSLECLATQGDDGWAYPNLRRLRLMQGEWEPSLLELVENRRHSGGGSSAIETIRMEGVDMEPRYAEALEKLDSPHPAEKLAPFTPAQLLPRSLEMKLLTYIIPLGLAVALVEANAPAADPQPHAPVKALKQVKRKELELHRKYPELFGRGHHRRVEYADVEERDIAPRSDPSAFPCKKRKRDVAGDFQILAPKEMADFLVNRGIYTHSNGSQLIDRHWIDEQDESERENQERSRWSRALREKFSDMLVNVGFHFYRHWKETAANGHDKLYHVSNNVGFDVRDIPAIERALLDDPNFKELKVWNYRLTRRLLEAAQAMD